jgi:hypothetical protein
MPYDKWVWDGDDVEFEKVPEKKVEPDAAPPVDEEQQESETEDADE